MLATLRFAYRIVFFSKINEISFHPSLVFDLPFEPFLAQVEEEAFGMDGS